jgi:hypothetical protein
VYGPSVPKWQVSVYTKVSFREVLLYHLSQLFINNSSASISVHQMLTLLIIYVITKYRFVITKWFTNHKMKMVKVVIHCCWWLRIYPHGKIHLKWPSLSEGIHETFSMTSVILCHGTLLKIQSSLLCSQYNYDIPIQDIHHLCSIPLIQKCFRWLSHRPLSGQNLQCHWIVQNLLDETATVTKRQLSMPGAGTRSNDSINMSHSNAHCQTQTLSALLEGAGME